jgi:hypothetical protein
MLYSHIGIPTTKKRYNEELVEGQGFSYYTTPYAANKWHVMWHRFPKNNGLPQTLTQLPHIAFDVQDLDKEIEEKKVLLSPYEPLPGYRVAIIEDGGFPIEVIETKLNEEEISALEQEVFDQNRS